MKSLQKVIQQFGFLILVLWLSMSMVACGDNGQIGSESLITGSNSKTWKADKELNAVGDKEKLSNEEKQETMQFYADGRFALGGGGMLQTGTWSYDESAKRLSLQFEDRDVTENFEVLKLTDDHMELKAADGSVMKLEAE